MAPLRAPNPAFDIGRNVIFNAWLRRESGGFRSPLSPAMPRRRLPCYPHQWTATQDISPELPLRLDLNGIAGLTVVVCSRRSGRPNGVLSSGGKRELATCCGKALSHNLPGVVDIVGTARSEVDNAHAADRPLQWPNRVSVPGRRAWFTSSASCPERCRRVPRRVEVVTHLVAEQTLSDERGNSVSREVCSCLDRIFVVAA